MDRRKFIKTVGIGSIPVIGATMISCESVNDSNSSSTDWQVDFNIMKEIAIIEAQAVNTYKDAIANKLTGDNIAVGELFKSHHQSHLDSYNAALSEVEWALIQSSALHPDYNTSGDETETLNFALTLEYTAASFYYSKLVDGVGSLTIRKLFADIFPMEMGHVVSLKSALGKENPNGATGMGLFEDFSSGV